MKNSSSLIIGVAIIMGFTILGLFLMASSKEDSKGARHEDRYELVPVNENNMIIFDKTSGAYWNKFVPSDEGPTSWEKGDSPIKKSNN
ncbi:hypothetical protein ACQKL6_05570 [Peribacillus sp. NPDC097197]|uniref:hypothetical protein n=1 Tax=Peribacillus sp. NPDC097197 TaxID=3390615 RepID=UPI003CFD2F41